MTKEWRCFHCDEVFTDKAAAREHFGATELQAPACTIDVAEYRAMETRMHRYNEEDTDLHRQIYGMQAEHQTALRREEEKGYARGLEAATAALLTLDRMGYTYTQGAQLWKPPIGPNPFEPRPSQRRAIDDLRAHLTGPLLTSTNDAPDPKAKCWCETCEPLRTRHERMIVCPDCGNKRCPRATWHGYACTGSNDVGQKGSSWENVKPPGVPSNVTPLPLPEGATHYVVKPGMPSARRVEVIRRARAAWNDKWPEQLTSGVMFYEGERITRAEFKAVK